METLYLDISLMEKNGYDLNIIENAKNWNNKIDAFYKSSIGNYLKSIITIEDNKASGGYLLSLEDIFNEIQEGVAPCGYIFP